MIRTAVLLSTLTAIMLAVGFFFAGIFGMTLALILAFTINFISYWFSDRIILRLYRARPADDPELKGIVESLAREAKIPKPKIYVIPSEIPNAFATGRNPKHSAVAVTDGLKALSRDEIEAVVAHEIAHIKNRDTLVQTVAATIAGAISYLAQIGYWSLFSGRDQRDRSGTIGLILIIIFAPLAALLVRMAISRRREYNADHEGALFSKKPMALASALRKITGVVSQTPVHGASATSHLWIVNPFRQDWFTSLFSTHPPVQRRISKLERMAAKGGEEGGGADD